jgi:3D (Asp-Asp-Asp) domain-containing protein
MPKTSQAAGMEPPLCKLEETRRICLFLAFLAVFLPQNIDARELRAFTPTTVSATTPMVSTDGKTAIVISEHRRVWVTAYSSTPEETDADPFITASGESVHRGIVATNFLPFGTKIKIPELFGDQIFIVTDRMHPRKKNFVDIWMPTKQEALRFGINRATIVIVDKDEQPQSKLLSLKTE